MRTDNEINLIQDNVIVYKYFKYIFKWYESILLYPLYFTEFEILLLCVFIEKNP